MNISRKEFEDNTRGSIGTRISDSEGNLYMPDNSKSTKRTVHLRKVEGKKLIWNEEGTKKIIVKGEKKCIECNGTGFTDDFPGEEECEICGGEGYD